jgi:hypothetical protein
MNPNKKTAVNAVLTAVFLFGFIPLGYPHPLFINLPATHDRWRKTRCQPP